MAKEKGFFDYLLHSPAKWRVLAAVLVGVFLIALSSASFTARDEREEYDIEEICSSIEGVGECRVILSYAADGETVASVAVICEGGDSLTVRHRLTELLSSFYGIGYHRVSIEKMK